MPDGIIDEFSLSRILNFSLGLALFSIVLTQILSSVLGHVPVSIAFISLTENNPPESYISNAIFLIVGTLFFLTQWILYKHSLKFGRINPLIAKFLLLCAAVSAIGMVTHAVVPLPKSYNEQVYSKDGQESLVETAETIIHDSSTNAFFVATLVHSVVMISVMGNRGDDKSLKFKKVYSLRVGVLFFNLISFGISSGLNLMSFDTDEEYLVFMQISGFFQHLMVASIMIHWASFQVELAEVNIFALNKEPMTKDEEDDSVL